MSYQPPQPYRPPPSRGRTRMTTRHKTVAAVVFSVLGLVAALVVIGAIGAALNRKTAGAGSTPPATPASSPAGSHAAAPPLSRSGRDGDFAFTVKSMSCGASSAAAVNAGGVGETVPAGAVECIVTMTVTDTKGAAQQFFDSNQYAYDKAGRQFSADTTGGLYLQGSQDGTQVNPGVAITAPVPFQIPAGDRITRLVLHDSAFSLGVTVRP